MNYIIEYTGKESLDEFYAKFCNWNLMETNEEYRNAVKKILKENEDNYAFAFRLNIVMKYGDGEEVNRRNYEYFLGSSSILSELKATK